MRKGDLQRLLETWKDTSLFSLREMQDWVRSSLSMGKPCVSWSTIDQRVNYPPSQIQFGNCLTLPHMKAFLFLTTLATVGIPIIAYPPSTIIYNDLRKILAWSYVDQYMQGAWWMMWYSWIPGPIGRWAIGITWSYWAYVEEVQVGMKGPSGFHLFLLIVGVGITFVALVSRLQPERPVSDILR